MSSVASTEFDYNNVAIQNSYDDSYLEVDTNTTTKHNDFQYESDILDKLTLITKTTTEEPIQNIQINFNNSNENPINLTEIGEEVDEELVVWTRAGKLGLIISNPDYGPPMIHHVKPISILYNKVYPGDRIIGVNEINTCNMSPEEISKLIGVQNIYSIIKITLIRTSTKIDYNSDTGNTAFNSIIDIDTDFDNLTINSDQVLT